MRGCSPSMFSADLDPALRFPSPSPFLLLFPPSRGEPASTTFGGSSFGSRVVLNRVTGFLPGLAQLLAAPGQSFLIAPSRDPQRFSMRARDTPANVPSLLLDDHRRTLLVIPQANVRLPESFEVEESSSRYSVPSTLSFSTRRTHQISARFS